MLKFFRKIRQKLLSENKFSKYLIYAIGEIVLVVIGILIALSINNWNENRKNNNELSKILIFVKNDLKADTLGLKIPLEAYKKTNLNIQKILDKEIPKSYFDTINKVNFEKCEFCSHQSVAYNHIFIQDKGIELLKKFTSTSSDTLISNILSFHNVYKEFFNDDNNQIKNLGRENAALLEKYNWYPEFRANKYNSDYISYISESNEYQNKIATYKVFSTTAVMDLEDYKKKAIKYIKILEENYPEK